MGAPNARPELVEIFSELVNNAAEHGMNPEGAQAHIRYMPHRRGYAFDAVIADPGPGIRSTLARNPALPRPETDTGAIGLAVQELVSGTGVPTRGIGL
jgi:anti-sigma regulatory factor (Ser/Thr protein kinase)